MSNKVFSTFLDKITPYVLEKICEKNLVTHCVKFFKPHQLVGKKQSTVGNRKDQDFGPPLKPIKAEEEKVVDLRKEIMDFVELFSKAGAGVDVQHVCSSITKDFKVSEDEFEKMVVKLKKDGELMETKKGFIEVVK